MRGPDDAMLKTGVNLQENKQIFMELAHFNQPAVAAAARAKMRNKIHCRLVLIDTEAVKILWWLQRDEKCMRKLPLLVAVIWLYQSMLTQLNLSFI